MTQRSSVPFDIWQIAGVTEHLGGVRATRRLLDLCGARQGQTVADLGCGTGYTACYLARTYGCSVVALDISPRPVSEARIRAVREGVDGRVFVTAGDVQCLPLADRTFDLVLAESVLAFCDPARVLHEALRVLKPGGAFGANELTLLGPPPGELVALLSEVLGIQGRQEAEWRAIFSGAGLVNVASAVAPINLMEQLRGHIETDGLAGYLSALVRGLTNAKINRAFLDRRMLDAARRFVPLVGYGLFTGRVG